MKKEIDKIAELIETVEAMRNRWPLNGESNILSYYNSVLNRMRVLESKLLIYACTSGMSRMQFSRSLGND